MNKQYWIDLAEIIDAWRVFPRIFFGAYIILFIISALWIMALPVVSVEQAGFAAAIVTAGAAWFNMYVKSGRTYKEKEK